MFAVVRFSGLSVRRVKVKMSLLIFFAIAGGKQTTQVWGESQAFVCGSGVPSAL